MRYGEGDRESENVEDRRGESAAACSGAAAAYPSRSAAGG